MAVEVKQWPRRVRWWVAPALVLLAILFTAAGRVDAALGRIEAPGSPSNTWGGLVTVTPLSQEARTEARTAWCVWFNTLPDRRQPLITQDTYKGSDPGPRVEACLDAFTGTARDQVFEPPTGGAEARLLIDWYVGLDVLLVLLYVLLLHQAWTALRARIPPATRDAETPAEATSASLGRATASSRQWLLIGGLVLVEAVENACQARLGEGDLTPARIDTLYRVVACAAVAKWALVGLAVLILTVLVVHTRVLATLPWRENLAVVRVQLFVSAVLLLLVAGFGVEQVPDALLGLLDHWSTAIATPVAVLVLSLLLWRSVHRTALTQDRALAPVRQRWLLLAALVCLALGIRLAPGLRGLAFVLGLVLVLSWIGGATVRKRTRSDPGAAVARTRAQQRADMITGRPRTSLETTARLLAALPLLALGVFAVRAAVAPAVVGPRRWSAVLLILLGLLAAAAGVVLPYLLKWAQRRCGWAMAPSPRHGRYGLYLALSGLCGLFVAVSIVTLVWDRTWNLPVRAGPIAVLTVFLCLALVILNELQRWSERATAVTGFRVLKLERTPVFVLLIAWFLLASTFDEQGHHQVRVHAAEVDSPVPDDDGLGLGEAFRSWAAANCATLPATTNVPAEARTGPPLPLVIVAASGGGVRAAYWTRSVLDQLFPPGPVTAAPGSACTPPDGRAPVFAVSGVSGGSLGAMSWIARTTPDAPAATAGHQEVFGQDHLSGALAWLTYVDLPRAFVGFGGKDRAAVLEQSWERRQEELKRPFYGTWNATGDSDAAAWTPLALFNGTAVESGCRVLTSPIQLGAFDRPVGPTSCTQRPERPREPGTGQEARPPGGPTLIDLRGGFLCGREDVNRSTAVLLSARFPWITPSGRLSGDACGHPQARLSVVDGGYVEATGSMTAVDLRDRLARVIDCHNQRVTGGPVPKGCEADDAVATRPVEAVLVQIDNGYSSVAAVPPPGRPRELLVPLKGKAAAVSTTEANVRQRAFEAFGCARYLPLANVRGPGTQAPLGWVLSKSAQQDLDDQLNRLRDEEGGKRLTLSGQLAQTLERCLPRA
ncbi:hypothetical protein ACFWV1_25240 [Streptomyces sp. NPDC058700]|uniref:hypothetical protein n=1 Tax=Streptomyces sp. NPDC058700 TaxID=3346607 RepID=UPI00366439D1